MKEMLDLALLIAIVTIVVPTLGGFVGAFFMWQFIKKYLKEKFLTKPENHDSKPTIKSTGGTDA